MLRPHVHKFGGSSLADADGYRRVAQTLMRLGQRWISLCCGVLITSRAMPT